LWLIKFIVEKTLCPIFLKIVWSWWIQILISSFLKELLMARRSFIASLLFPLKRKLCEALRPRSTDLSLDLQIMSVNYNMF
jgi:hypothetical protein